MRAVAYGMCKWKSTSVLINVHIIIIIIFVFICDSLRPSNCVFLLKCGFALASLCDNLCLFSQCVCFVCAVSMCVCMRLYVHERVCVCSLYVGHLISPLASCALTSIPSLPFLLSLMGNLAMLA